MCCDVFVTYEVFNLFYNIFNSRAIEVCHDRSCCLMLLFLIQKFSFEKLHLLPMLLSLIITVQKWIFINVTTVLAPFNTMPLFSKDLITFIISFISLFNSVFCWICNWWKSFLNCSTISIKPYPTARFFKPSFRLTSSFLPVYTSLLLIITLRFTCGKMKIE